MLMRRISCGLDTLTRYPCGCSSSSYFDIFDVLDWVSSAPWLKRSGASRSDTCPGVEDRISASTSACGTEDSTRDVKSATQTCRHQPSSRLSH